MGLKDAERTLKVLGNTIKHNTPGPRQLYQGFLDTHVFSPALPFLIMIGFLLLFGEPICYWLTH